MKSGCCTLQFGSARSSFGGNHEFRADVFVKVFLTQSLEFHGALFERKALLVSVFATLEAMS
jgi:hypothetical protein